jgi:hypothetical protein
LLVFEMFIWIGVVPFVPILFIAGFWDVYLDCCCAVCSCSAYCPFLRCLYGLLLGCLFIFCSLLAFEMFILIAVVSFGYIVLIARFWDV